MSTDDPKTLTVTYGIAPSIAIGLIAVTLLAGGPFLMVMVQPPQTMWAACSAAGGVVFSLVAWFFWKRPVYIIGSEGIACNGLWAFTLLEWKHVESFEVVWIRGGPGTSPWLGVRLNAEGKKARSVGATAGALIVKAATLGGASYEVTLPLSDLDIGIKEIEEFAIARFQEHLATRVEMPA
jgi:hypothetical protein